MERHEVVLDRRDLHQFPDSGRGAGTNRGRAGQESAPAGRGEGSMGPRECIPDQPEHHARFSVTGHQSPVTSQVVVTLPPTSKPFWLLGERDHGAEPTIYPSTDACRPHWRLPTADW